MPGDARVNELVNELLNTHASLMVATAKMVAHYVAAAAQSGASSESVNAVLLDVTETTGIEEVFVTDADGNIEFGSHPALSFKSPTGPGADTQAAPFAQLLAGTASEGTATVVVQDPSPPLNRNGSSISFAESNRMPETFPRCPSRNTVHPGNSSIPSRAGNPLRSQSTSSSGI